MADINTLAGRIDAEFSSVADKVKKFQTDQVQEHKDRQKRLEQLGKVFDQLSAIWRPRLELLVKKFGDRVQTTPRIVPSSRQVTFAFQSNVARVRLMFSAFTDRDVRKVILAYNLELIPALMRFNSHSEVEFPLNEVDPEAVAKWMDDRIVEFIQTYFAMGENEIYLKDEMVGDPIAGVRFPKQAAATTLEWQGQKFYFIGEETRQEFVKQQGIKNTDQEGQGEAPGQSAAARAAALSAEALAKVDTGVRKVDDAIHGADGTRKKVFPEVPDPYEEP